jgi:glucan phosphoethanolaminetransferase (alkaline phosphatase superfamily)
MAVISRERTRATWFTGVAGLLLLGVAIVMMVVAAPSQAQPLPHHAQAKAQAYTPSAQLARGPRSTTTDRGPTVT